MSSAESVQQRPVEQGEDHWCEAATPPEARLIDPDQASG